ncbi:hypothetical protein FZEAL_7929 [Fusarium zealandicum]|uniref:rRNA methyltransferase 1, mitochondrial n=1 Tax=Fusarium zealandicum TaxID=1053134 RepID=A0A8H4UF18_9HYPO|nr:hypothetical protein FZEAL_7929 [Fusarium zealandicum]
MMYLAQLRQVALRRPLVTLIPVQASPSRICVRAKSLSAIHRGMRGSEKAQYGEARSRPVPSFGETHGHGPADRRSRPRSPPATSRREAPGRREASGRREAPGRRESPSRRETPSRGDDFMEKFNARAIDGTRNWRQEQKLRKKLRKKAEEKATKNEDEEGGRRTRRKRFTDPENDFGKRSLVYQLKYGELKDVAAKLPVKEFVKPRSFREAREDQRFDPQERDSQAGQDTARAERRFDRPERDAHSGRDAARTERRFDRPTRDAYPRSDTGRSERRFDRPDRPDRDARSSRDTPGTERRFGRSDRDDRNSTRPERRFGRPDRDADSGQDAARIERRFGRSDHSPYTRQDSTRNERWSDQGDEDSAPRQGRRKEMMPMTIKYTTAASQFLYGRSVVKAALEQSRRKLYNLYIYGGENRKDNKDNTILTRLAEKHSVPITIVPTGEQRLMDKMSMGRPHNGFVLEASPLPQLPIKSLGKLEETPARLGFHVEMDFQTKEDQAINGANSFVQRANDVMPKPFVLLLNEIIDPGNLGGIIRTASYLGIDAVGITSRGSSALTPVTLKSAAGAVEEISLFTVDDAQKFIEGSRRAGWKTYAAVAPPDRKLVRKHGDKFISTDAIEAQSPLNEHPCLLILGNEGHGLSKPLKVAADYEVSVPRFVQGSCVDSLNVSVAAGLLCHSFVKEPQAEVEAKEVDVKEAASQQEIAEAVSKLVDSQAEEKPLEEISAETEGTREERPQEPVPDNAPEAKKPEEKRSEEDVETVF